MKTTETQLFLDFILATNPKVTVGGAGRALKAHRNYLESERLRVQERKLRQKERNR